MIDHAGFNCTDIKRSKDFYARALAPLGYTVLKEFPAAMTGTTDVAGLGAGGKPDFWLAQGTPQKPHVHVAFRASSRQVVDDFHEAAVAAGGKDNGAPGPRPHYHADYYGAFVTDFDGHNVEVVCHDPVR